MKITNKQKYILAGGGVLLVSIAIAVPLIVQSTKQNTTSFNLSIIKTQMQMATNSKATREETQIAIVKMYQNGTTQNLSLQAQKAAQVLAHYIYENRARKKFAFVLGKDHQDQQLLLLTIANNRATPQVDVSLQKVIPQVSTSTPKQDDLSLVKQLQWVTNALHKAEFGILFWIYQNRLFAQEALPGTSKVPPSITATNFQRVKTPQEQLQDLAQEAIQNLVVTNFTTGINKAQIASAGRPNKTHVISDIKKQINNSDAQALILPSDITITSNNITRTITIVIDNHGPSKTITIMGFRTIKDYLDQILIALPSSGGALVIPEGITSNQFDAYVQAMGVVLNAKGELVINKFARQYRAKITSLTIPHSFTTIGPWFQHFDKIKSLSISNSVTTIGNLAFEYSLLTTLSLGDQLQTIGNHAFASAKLTSLHIPNAVTIIGNEAFYNSLLTSLSLGDQLQTIGDSAFRSAQLPSLLIPNSVTTIGDSAFRSAQLPSLLIPNSVTTIGAYAFNKSPLTTLSLGDQLQTIGDYAFYKALLKTLTIPNSVTTIGAYAFQNSPLRTLLLGDQLQTIGDYAFYKAQLTFLTIPNSVTEIKGGAFFNSPLENINIFDGVTLGSRVFRSEATIKRISRPT